MAEPNLNYQEICETALKIAENFGKHFSFQEQDIDELEEILEIYHQEYVNHECTEQQIWNVSVIWGIYLGQVLIEKHIGAYGYRWKMEDGFPLLAKDNENKMSPIIKVQKRILNGAEDSVKSFYQVACAIADGRFSLGK